MTRFKIITILLGILFFAIPQLCLAEVRTEKLEDIQVTAPRLEDIVVTPSTTIINVEEYKTPGIPQNITDILKNRAIIDFRGQSDLVPSNDTIQMRGFGGQRFITAINGLTLEKSGFGYSNYAVDYALLSLSQIDEIEIIPVSRAKYRRRTQYHYESTQKVYDLKAGLQGNNQLRVL
jgi:hypothetical protein